MSCSCSLKDKLNQKLFAKLHNIEAGLVDRARGILRTAGDPVSAVIRFLHERPEEASLKGLVMHYVLRETFGDEEKIPGLIKLFTGHVSEIIRHANVIDIINEHPAVERWGKYLIKQKERIKFEIAKERELLVLKNIVGLIAVEQGMDLPVDKISVQPPNLIVTVKLGLLRPQRVFDIA
ncbi:MAG: hypothetical protein C5B53_05645 [Candidatus Melainabacteria bacterium]|nr:MAG: hypothetical protein C5B53_05645 [Candidatus Melainabacteria bacterium]